MFLNNKGRRQFLGLDEIIDFLATNAMVENYVQSSPW